MKSPCTSAVRYLALVAAIGAGLWRPAVASAGEGGQGTAPPPRRELSEAHRESRDALKFKLKKAMKSGELWTGFWWGGPRECYTGWSGQNSPGLVTKAYSLARGQTEPDGFRAWQYDRHGNSLMQESVSTAYGAAQWDRTECEYADRGDLQKGKLVRMTSTSSQFPAWPVYRATYNARDQHDVETEEHDFDDNGTIDAFAYTRYIYNDLGLLVEQVFEHDYDANGTIDYRYAAKGSYDARHRLQRLVKGFYDYPGGPFVPYRTFWVTIDDASATSVATEETDYDGDGVTDDRNQWTNYYDDAGRIDHAVYLSDYDGRPGGGADGVADYEMKVRHEYDPDGNETHTIYDISGIHTLSFMDDYRMTYDARGRLIRMVYYTETYWNGEVYPDGDTTTYTRNQHGKLVEQVNFRQTSWFSQTYRNQYRYDGMGNLIEDISSFRWNDDPPEYEYRTIYEYAAGRSGQSGSGSK